MDIAPATPDLPGIDLTHGAGALVLTLRDERGRQMGTVLTPDQADHLAALLTDQATDARQAYHRTLLGVPPPATG